VRKLLLGLFAAGVVGCSSEKAVPPDSDPAAQEKAIEALRQQQKDMKAKGIKNEGIPKGD
jgi:hypothetical protein